MDTGHKGLAERDQAAALPRHLFNVVSDLRKCSRPIQPYGRDLSQANSENGLAFR